MFIEVDNRVFEDIIFHSQDGIWSIDSKYIITAINPAAVDLLYRAFGIKFAIGENINDHRDNPQLIPLINDLGTALKGDYFSEQESLFISEGERV
ncbi:MAG: hypothetical protein CVU45_04520, partial [Chloroflexi bacterium HGW-Chloroflexi-7]